MSDSRNPSNAWLWQSVKNLAEALRIAELSSRGEVFAVDYADAELARITTEADIISRANREKQENK